MKFEPYMLVVNSGQRTDRAFRNIPGFKTKSIVVEELRYHNLYGYTAVIIASWSRDITLSQNTTKLVNFVNDGGILVCLGCQCHEAQWIPFCKWENGEPTNEFWSDNNEDSRLILDGIDKNHLDFHGFIGHGTIEPPPNTKDICTGDGKSVMCLIDEEVKGAALITTIDPDFHAFMGRISRKQNETECRKEAKLLLVNIYRWSLYKFNEKHSVSSYFMRKLIGSVKMSNFYLVLALPTWIISVYVSAIYIYKNNTYDPFIAIPSAASMIGLAIMMTDKFLERKRIAN